MAYTITVPDLEPTNFDDYFKAFVISRQTDGEGGVVYIGTLACEITRRDDAGNPIEPKQVSLSKTLAPAAKSALRDFIRTNYLAELKLQERV